MKEKKVIVSVRCPLWMLAGVDKFASIWKFRDRSKTILYALEFFLGHVTPEDWHFYYCAPYPKVKEAWDAFWSVLRSAAVESNKE